MGSITKDGVTQLDLIVANDKITNLDNGEPGAKVHFTEAVEIILDYLDAFPGDPVGLFTFGRAMLTVKHSGIAKTIYETLIGSNGDQWQLWCNLGRANDDQHDYAEAKRCYHRALEIDPDCGEAFIGLSVSHVMSCEPVEAIEWSQRAIAIGHKEIRAHTNMGYAHLMLGHYGKGWDEYAYGLGYTTGRQRRAYGGVEDWDGEKSEGIRLIVYGEQGLGEYLAWCSILPDVMRDVQIVALEVDQKIAPLLQRTFPALRVFGTLFSSDLNWHPEIEPPTHCVALSAIGRWYRRELADFPGTPYLVADPERRVQWRGLLDSLGAGLKIGIAWTGGNLTTNRKGRSVSLHDLSPLTQQPHHFISLEYKDRSEEIATARMHGVQIHDWPWATMSDNYDDNASLIAELDMVIGVPTAAIHCAGALGIEAHVITPPHPLFHYPQHIDHMPYYGSTHLHRRTDYSKEALTATLESILPNLEASHAQAAD